MNPEDSIFSILFLNPESSTSTFDFDADGVDCFGPILGSKTISGGFFSVPLLGGLAAIFSGTCGSVILDSGAFCGSIGSLSATLS